MLDRGAVTVSELHTALEATHRKGGRLGTHLLRLRFVTEEALLEALEEQTGVPAVPESVILEASDDARRELPIEIQRRLMAVPFRKGRTHVDVAMVNPLDPELVEKVRDATGLDVRVHVASERAIEVALAGRSDVTTDRRPAQEETARGEIPSEESWDCLWRPPRVDAEMARRLRPISKPVFGGRVVAFPSLESIVDVHSGEGGAALDHEVLLSRLAGASNREQVSELLLSYVRGYLSRVVLFVVHKTKVVGWSASGEGVVVDDVQSLMMPIDRPSLFLNLLHTGGHYRGPVPPGEANAILSDALGSPEAREVLALPIRVKGRAVMFAFGDNPGGGLGELPIEELEDVSRRVGLALEVVILKTKIRS